MNFFERKMIKWFSVLSSSSGQRLRGSSVHVIEAGMLSFFPVTLCLLGVTLGRRGFIRRRLNGDGEGEGEVAKRQLLEISMWK
jgi:hypothetical protein